ncbi:unnamed protein product [Phytomonas sp. EM1]|nr:unnamed protein product [Phytomonas sp. EM1]|eukprot:CCW61310.1 unnamed protein product [Phytomonas sp. isolate EM1]
MPPLPPKRRSKTIIDGTASAASLAPAANTGRSSRNADEERELHFLKVARTRAYPYVRDWFERTIEDMEAKTHTEFDDALTALQCIQIPESYEAVRDVRSVQEKVKSNHLAMIARVSSMIRWIRDATNIWLEQRAQLVNAHVAELKEMEKALIERRQRAEGWMLHGERERVMGEITRFQEKRRKLAESSVSSKAREMERRERGLNQLKKGFESCLEEVRDVIGWYALQPKCGSQASNRRLQQLREILGEPFKKFLAAQKDLGYESNTEVSGDFFRFPVNKKNDSPDDTEGDNETRQLILMERKIQSELEKHIRERPIWLKEEKKRFQEEAKGAHIFTVRASTSQKKGEHKKRSSAKSSSVSRPSNSTSSSRTGKRRVPDPHPKESPQSSGESDGSEDDAVAERKSDAGERRRGSELFESKGSPSIGEVEQVPTAPPNPPTDGEAPASEEPFQSASSMDTERANPKGGRSIVSESARSSSLVGEKRQPALPAIGTRNSRRASASATATPPPPKGGPASSLRASSAFREAAAPPAAGETARRPSPPPTGSNPRGGIPRPSFVELPPGTKGPRPDSAEAAQHASPPGVSYAANAESFPSLPSDPVVQLADDLIAEFSEANTVVAKTAECNAALLKELHALREETERVLKENVRLENDKSFFLDRLSETRGGKVSKAPPPCSLLAKTSNLKDGKDPEKAQGQVSVSDQPCIPAPALVKPMALTTTPSGSLVARGAEVDAQGNNVLSALLNQQQLLQKKLDDTRGRIAVMQQKVQERDALLNAVFSYWQKNAAVLKHAHNVNSGRNSPALQANSSSLANISQDQKQHAMPGESTPSIEFYGYSLPHVREKLPDLRTVSMPEETLPGGVALSPRALQLSTSNSYHGTSVLLSPGIRSRTKERFDDTPLRKGNFQTELEGKSGAEGLGNSGEEVLIAPGSAVHSCNHISVEEGLSFPDLGKTTLCCSNDFSTILKRAESRSSMGDMLPNDDSIAKGILASLPKFNFLSQSMSFPHHLRVQMAGGGPENEPCKASNTPNNSFETLIMALPNNVNSSAVEDSLRLLQDKPIGRAPSVQQSNLTWKNSDKSSISYTSKADSAVGSDFTPLLVFKQISDPSDTFILQRGDAIADFICNLFRGN